MPQVTACPELSQYQRLAAGQLEEVDRDSVLEHLERCNSCARRLDALNEPDNLVEIIRSAQAQRSVASPEIIARLVERLSKLRPGETDAVANKPTVPTPEPVALRLTPVGETAQQIYDFLVPPQAPDELGRLGPYRVLQVLGTGGMGIVFRAEDPHLARLVALKAMLPALAARAGARERFLREARAAAAIRHDHIVTIYQVGEDRGVPFLAMELLEGEPLDARLKREGKLPVSEILRLGREISLGLAAAHKRGLIHRDIKPANLWLEGDGRRVKILDFGLARAVGQDHGLTLEGAIVGTPTYMAPEQAQGKSVDQRCDLFSLGCVLYWMATGQAPFGGTDMVSLLLAVATADPEPPQKLNGALPSSLSELILSLLAKEPGSRPGTAQEVSEVLERIGREPAAQPLLAKTSTLPPAVKRATRKGPILAGVAACLLLVLLGLWSMGIFKLRTKNGTIVLENIPADAEVLVDGEKVALKLTGSGNLIEIQAAPGKRKLEIKTAGFKMETRDVTLAAGERKPISIRLEPLPEPAVKKLPKELVTPQTNNADRVVALWVFSQGGKIDIRANGKVMKGIDSTAGLPAYDFQLGRVEMRNRELSVREVAQFKRTPNLWGIFLDQCRIGDAGLAALGELTNLEELQLCNAGISDAGLVYLQNMKRLQTVSFFANPGVTDLGLSRLTGLTKIAYLDLNGTQITNAGLKRLRHLPDLHWLNLISTKIGDGGLTSLEGLPNLKQLLIGLNNLSDRGMLAVGRLTNLELLDIGDMPIGDEGLRPLARLSKLRHLGLYGTEVSNQGLSHLEKLNGLRVLYLGRTSIGDEGLKHIAHLPELYELELNGTQVTDAGIDPLLKLRRLMRLHVKYTRISARGFARLKKAFPKAYVAWSAPEP